MIRSFIQKIFPLCKESKYLSFSFDDYNHEEDNFGIQFIGSKRPQIKIGRGSHSGESGLLIYCWDERIKVNIGRYCSIADKVIIVAGGEHDIDWVTSYPFIDRWEMENLYYGKKPRFKGDIEIGSDVWIATSSMILSGVKIGHGAVIGAGSVVTKNVPPYAIVGGNPARIIRYRFNKDQIEKLLSIRWWNWSEEKIKNNMEDFLNINLFIKKFSREL